MRERLGALGAEPTSGTSEQFAHTGRGDMVHWAKVETDAVIHIDLYNVRT